MFSVIKDILVRKSGRSLLRNDFNDVYNPYMVQRWISMHSNLNVVILNDSVNMLYKSLTDEQQFILLSNILPSCPVDGKYIKVKARKSNSKKDKDDGIDISLTFEESSTKIEESLKAVLGDKYNE